MHDETDQASGMNPANPRSFWRLVKEYYKDHTQSQEHWEVVGAGC
jgi:hypothetical protein